jgi:translation initiation factor 2 beta subunit (eIF-2beta)/eIF-5
LCHKFNVHGYPKIKLFPAGTTNYTGEIPYWKVHPFDALSQLNIRVDKLRLDEIIAKDDENNQQSNSSVLGKAKSINNAQNHPDGINHDSAWPIRSKQQIYNDAYLSFDFNLRNEIFTSSDGPLHNSTQNALREWLELLQRTVPVGWSQVQTVVREILLNFDTAVRSDTNFTKILDQASEKSSPHISSTGTSSRKWSSACTRGVAAMGYTCGLWELFHIMTVGVVEYNLMISEDNDDGILFDTQISASHAAETLRNFIEHFFGCTECRYNFLSSYDACGHDHCSRFDENEFSNQQWIQLPIWLFETHNSVNVRLLHEAADRNSKLSKDTTRSLVSPHDEIHKQWPPRHLCPKCWTNQLGAFHEESVFKYLRAEYWYVLFVRSFIRLYFQ